MLRTLLKAVLVSCVLGASLGAGVAYLCLSIDGWQPELETASYGNLVTTTKAKAHVEETAYHFGLMDAKTSGSHDFYIKNIGTEDMILMLGDTTCACTGIEISLNRVPPGATAKCTLKFSAEQAETGKFSHGGIIKTNDPHNREIRLMVEGVFTEPVVLQPAAVNMPSVPFGREQKGIIRFYSFETEPLQLFEPMWTDREYFGFEWNVAVPPGTEEAEDYLSAANWVVEGTITVKPGLPAGPFQDRFQVKTNCPRIPNLVFSVSGQVTSGNVSVRGQGYNRTTGVALLGQTIVGNSLSREISIQFSGTSAQSASVQIKAVEPSWIQAALSQPSDRGNSLRIFTLTIEVPENARTGSYVFGGEGPQAHITLETNDESMPVLRIPLQFTVGRQ